MAIREALLPALIQRFGDRGLRTGIAPEPIATFPARHPEVGDVTVLGTWVDATVTVGEIVGEHFQNYDAHLDASERAKRVTTDVVRFLGELFADRLLFWKSTDGRGSGWRERGDAGHVDPIVIDDRRYRLYLWSGPFVVWQATPQILARGRIRDGVEHELVVQRLDNRGPDGFEESERDLARQLVADYERRKESE